MARVIATHPALAPSRLTRWLIFVILVLAYVMSFFQRMAPATVATDIMNDLRAREGVMGLLSAAYFYPHALMQIPVGILADRWGAKRTIGVFFLVAALGSMMFAWADSLVSTSVGRFLVGAGMATLFVPALKIFSMWFHGREFAWVAGLFVSAGGIGSLLAAAPLAMLIQAFGWRASFFWAGVVTLVIAVLALTVIRDRPPSEEGPPPGRAIPSEPSAEGIWKSFSRILTLASFWPLALWFFFGNGSFFTFAGLWAGPYLEDVYGLGKSGAGNVLAMMSVGLIIGGALLSSLSSSIFHSRKRVMILSSAVMAALFGAMAGFTSTLPVPILVVVFLLLGLFGQGAIGIAFTLVKETFPPHLSGTAMGMVNVSGFLGPAVLQPVIGYALEHLGSTLPEDRYGHVLTILLGCTVATVAAAVVAREPREISEREPTLEGR